MKFFQHYPDSTILNWGIVLIEDEYEDPKAILDEFLENMSKPEYQPTGDFRLSGLVINSSRFDDGSPIITSPVKMIEVIQPKGAKGELRRATTQTGSTYHFYTDDASLMQVQATIDGMPAVLSRNDLYELYEVPTTI